MSLAIFITFGILAVFVLPKWNVNPYSVHRTTIFSLLGFGLLAYWLFESRTTYLPKTDLIILLFMYSWWLIVSAMSEWNYISMKWCVPFILFSATPMILIDPSNKDIGIAIIVLGGVANGIYGILQRYFNVNLFKSEHSYKPRYASGFISRGTNLLGTYLPVSCFLALHLGVNANPYWFIAIPFTLAGLYATSSRLGYVGLIVGALTYSAVTGNPWVYIPAFVVCVVGAVILIGLFQGKVKSVSDRKKYLQLAWTQFKRTGLFGIGFDVMKTKVPFLQRELNRKTEGNFMLDYHHPVVQKMHNDVIQNILDVGVVGFIPLAYLMFKAITNISNPEIHAAFVTFVVCGMFIHLFYWPNTNILFWILMAFQLQTGSTWSFEWNPVYIGILILMGVIVYQYVIRIQILHYFKEKMQTTGLVKTRDPLDKCLKWGEQEGDLRCTEIKYEFAVQNFVNALKQNQGQLYRYDGDHMIWNLYNSLGHGYLYVGSLYMAKAMFRESLSFLPANPDAMAGIKKVEQIESQLKGGNKR